MLKNTVYIAADNKKQEKIPSMQRVRDGALWIDVFICMGSHCLLEIENVL